MDSKFICVEGIDGSGSTTTAKLLTKRLNKECGIDALYTKEPSDGIIGRHIRRILVGEEKMEEMGMLPLFFADRWDHVCNVIIPEMNRGTWVICDRYTLSTLVYQQDNYPADIITRLIQGLPLRPDWLFVLDAPVGMCQQRIHSRAGALRIERYESKELQECYLDRYREAVWFSLFGERRELLSTEKLSVEQVVDTIIGKVIAIT